jgi:hypothetical protein
LGLHWFTQLDEASEPVGEGLPETMAQVLGHSTALPLAQSSTAPPGNGQERYVRAATH